MTRISNLTALASADSGDTLPILDVSATTTKKITKTAFLSDVVNGTLMSAQSITPTKVDLSVANDAARTALSSPFEGLTVYQEDTDAFYIYDGTAWRRQAQWEELGRTTLGVAGDSISVTPIAARKFLMCFFHLFSTGGTLSVNVRYNNDSATNYAQNYSIGFTAGINNVSQTSIGITSAGALVQGTQFGVFLTNNYTAQRKLLQGTVLDDNNANATSSVNHGDFRGKWDNTAAQITRIDLVNNGTGDFAIGSNLLVLGRD